MTKTDELNRLEREATKKDQAADSVRWRQAKLITARLSAEPERETEREIAASWINGRTGKPYTHVTVDQFAAAWREFGKVPFQDRPPFWQAVEQAKGTTTRSQRSEAQPPKSVATATKLVQNMAKNSSQEVRDAVFNGLLALKAEMHTTTPRSASTPKTLFQQYAKGIWEIVDLAERMKDEIPEPSDREPMMRMTQTLRGFLERIESYLRAPEEFDWEAFEAERREWEEAAK